MKYCVNCKAENKQNWFYCRSCGQKTSEPKFTTNLFKMSNLGKRTDIELRTTTMQKDIQERNKRRSYVR
jgi:uncharacterized membrane protein YvbJ